MNTPEDIRDQVELYLQGELDAARSEETAGLIQSDPAWQEIHAQLLVERRGIRFHSLQSYKNNLFEYEAELTNQEKNQEKEGDLSSDATFTYTTNDDKGVEVKTQSHEMEENYPIDQSTEQGIRYTTLKGELDKLKQEEKGLGGSVLPKKNGGRVVGMRKYWWAVAAGVMVIVLGGYFLAEYQKPKYVNQYLMDHFDEYILHDKYRSANPEEKLDRDKEIGYDLYVLKEFEQAIPYLKRRWEEKRDTVALFYLGVSYAGTGDKKNTIQVLNKIKYHSQNKILIQNLIK